MKPAHIRHLLSRACGAALAVAAVALPLQTGAQTAARSPAKLQPTRPNVVVILLDDVGFSDVGAFGSEIPTPNIDALAKGGLSFTQFYNSARCSPSRASLLTGTYPHQAGLGHLEGTDFPGAQGLQSRLLDRVVTMAEVAKSAGYYTAMAGKWHVGMGHGVAPWQRGFDHSTVTPYGELYFPNQPQPMTQNVYLDGEKVPTNSPRVGTGNWYSSDMFVDWQTKFFKQAESEHKPFFLYMPFTAAHFPIMAPPEDVAKFKGKYMRGWDVIRRARFEKQKKLGIIPANAELPPALANTYDWNKLSAADKDRFDTMMAVYAAAISRVDRAIGTLVARLKASGELDNTLILFMCDNGGNGESGPDGRLNGKGTPGSAQSVVWTGMNWATLQNTPFQYFKHFTEEGGIATPLIAYWPQGIAAKQRGTKVTTPGHLIDVMPTLVEVSGATYPKSFNGHEIVPMQGRSMVPAFTGKPLTRATPIFWEHEGNRAVRDGKWKLVARFEQPWQLFDMDADRAEMHDLAAAQPDRVNAMAAQYDAWAARSFVDPWREEYDRNSKGRTRQNWGGFEPLKLPEAVRD
ncbi:arylsulfatase [Sphingomonas sp. HITSZ_GF]|uniref:arylsulfatase n=1 Tax=Sphingomonas sp. HITSZ_GF TaxID=3037247 RepID=UPI00240E38C8|nr:arylsulfatase [Sphingomonas sp. HITSZ_GF]MDG2534266.1 arylsulfatase [Sphingomonas sp. HITSZ_GF]